MENEPLRVPIPNSRPFFVAITENNVTRDIGSEAFFPVFVARKMKRRLQLFETTVPGWGNFYGPGNWSGAIGMVVRKEADFLPSLYPSTEELFTVFDYSPSGSFLPFGIISGSPRKVNSQAGAFFSSISFEIWVCLGVSWIFISLLSYLMSKTENTMMSGKRLSSETFMKNLFSHYGLLFERGLDFIPESNARRVLLTGWLILSVVLMNMVGGTLSSKLAVEDIPDRIEGIEDVLKYPSLCPYITKGMVVDDVIRNFHEALWNVAERCNGVRPVEDFHGPELVDKLKEGTGVLLGEMNYILPSILGAHCMKRVQPMYETKEPFYTVPMNYLHRKGMGFEEREQYRISSIMYVEHGFLQEASEMYKRNTKLCHQEGLSRTTSISSMKLKDSLKIFELLFVGLAVSFTFFLMEIFSVMFHF